MALKLDDLKKKGAFVSPDLVKTSVEWVHTDPETNEIVTDTFDIFVKKISFGDLKRAYSDNTIEAQSSLISSCVRLGENAEEEITYEDAYALEGSLGLALIEAVNKVIGIGSKEPKKSKPAKKSGTS